MTFYGYIYKLVLQQDSLDPFYLWHFCALWSFPLMNAMFHQHEFYYMDIELYKSHYLSYIL